MKSYLTKETDANIRGHRSDWHKKITLSLACIIFFFIGAPLGAIIRKGGLGMPVVLSVLIFILYYIIDSGATRVAKSGEMNIILGTWMSTLVLAPLGGFLTYKSNKDSVVFNIDVTLLSSGNCSASVRAGTSSRRKLLFILPTMQTS